MKVQRRYSENPPGTDNRLKTGPYEERGCTDPICCILFAVFWIGMIVIMVYSLKYGHPENLATQLDIKTCQANQGTQSFCNMVRNGTESTDRYVADLKVAWPLFLAALGIALFFGFGFLLLMRYLSGVMTWIMIVLYVIILAILGYLCIRTSQSMANDDAAAGKPDDRSSARKVLIGFAVFLWVVDAITVLLVCCFYSQIQLAISILKAAADFLNYMPQTLLAPLVKIITTAAFLAYWIVVFVYLYSIGDLSKDQGSQLAGIQWDKDKGYILSYHVFGLLWTCAFIVAIEQFVVASCAALWYYAAGAGQFTHNPLTRSFYRAFRYHIGSMAFGSLILALIQGMRVALEYANAKVKASVGANGLCIGFVLNCARCFLACFERFIRFLNRHAYVYIAMTGSSFCAAAQEGFSVILANPVRFAVLNGVGSVFFFLGQMFVSITTTILCYLIVTGSDYYKNALYSPVLPTIFFFLIAYLVAELIIDVYDMAANTLLHCFCIDERSNNGVPRFPPRALKDYVASVAQHK